MVWHSPAPGLLAQPRQTPPGCPWQAPGSPAWLSPLSPALPPPQWCRFGTRAPCVPGCPSPTHATLTMPNREHCCAALGTALLSQGDGDSPARATRFPPVPWHTVAGPLCMPGAWGDCDPRALGLIGARVPGYPGHTGYGGLCGCQGHPAFVVTRGPKGAGDMREIPRAGSTPVPVCMHSGGAGVPGTPAPGMLRVLGGPRGSEMSGSFQRFSGSWGFL